MINEWALGLWAIAITLTILIHYWKIAKLELMIDEQSKGAKQWEERRSK